MVPALLPDVLEGQAVTTQTNSSAEPAYRVYVSHTMTCSTCLVGRPCVTAAQLGSAWRKTRRR